MIYNITIIGNKLHFQTQLDSSPAFLCIPASFLCIPVHSCSFLSHSCVFLSHSCRFRSHSCGFLQNPEIPEGICGAVRSTAITQEEIDIVSGKTKMDSSIEGGFFKQLDQKAENIRKAFAKQEEKSI